MNAKGLSRTVCVCVCSESLGLGVFRLLMSAPCSAVTLFDWWSQAVEVSDSGYVCVCVCVRMHGFGAAWRRLTHRVESDEA